MEGIVHKHFGSKRGFLRFLGYWIATKLGAFRNFPPPRLQADQRIVFICSGNICRSPLAEVYARSLGREAKSCGLDCGNGFPADPRAIEFAKRNGLSLDDHLTVNISNFEFYDNDLIIVMEPSHLRSFLRKAGKTHCLALAGHYCDKPMPYIHDPFNCCADFFEKCESIVMEAVRKICDS